MACSTAATAVSSSSEGRGGQRDQPGLAQYADDQIRPVITAPTGCCTGVVCTRGIFSSGHVLWPSLLQRGASDITP